MYRFTVNFREIESQFGCIHSWSNVIIGFRVNIVINDLFNIQLSSVSSDSLVTVSDALQ